MSGGETDPVRLVRNMDPRRNEGEWVFVRVDAVPASAEPVVVVAEDEGTTLVLRRDRADALGLAYGPVMTWITLRIHSSLEAVGLTAAVSAALADAGVPANVVAGYTHDHLFVPVEQAGAAMRALHALAASWASTGL